MRTDHCPTPGCKSYPIPPESFLCLIHNIPVPCLVCVAFIFPIAPDQSNRTLCCWKRPAAQCRSRSILCAKQSSTQQPCSAPPQHSGDGSQSPIGVEQHHVSPPWPCLHFLLSPPDQLPGAVTIYLNGPGNVKLSHFFYKQKRFIPARSPSEQGWEQPGLTLLFSRRQQK